MWGVILLAMSCIFGLGFGWGRILSDRTPTKALSEKSNQPLALSSDNSKYFLQDTEAVEPFLRGGWAQVIMVKYWWIEDRRQVGQGTFQRHFKGPMSFSLMLQILKSEICKYDGKGRESKVVEIVNVIHGSQEKIVDNKPYREIT